MAGQELKTTSIREGGVGDFHLLSIVCLSTFHHALKQEQCLSCSPIHPIPQPRVWSTSIGASHPTSSCSRGSPRCAALFSVSVTVHSSVQVREARLHSPSLPHLHSRNRLLPERDLSLPASPFLYTSLSPLLPFPT